MEDGRTTQEQQDFNTPFNAPDATTYSQIRSSSYSRKSSPYGQGYSMYVVNRVGPGKKLAVAPGDHVLVEVYAGYPQAGVIANLTSPKASLFMAGAGATLLAQPPRPAVEATAPATPGWQRALGQLSLGVSIPLFSKQAATKSSAAPLSSPPNASLRYILRLVRDQSVVRSGTVAVSSAAEGQWQLLSFDVQVDTEEPAQLEVWVQSDDSREMYFDDLRIENQAGPIVQENHFYAYGQRNDGLSWTRQYQRPYGRGYQGQNTRFDTETGYDNFELRLYDSRIGRWLSKDPMGQYHSPYVGMGNNPISGVDSNGGFNEIGVDVKTGKEYSLSNLGGSEYDIKYYGYYTDKNTAFVFNGTVEILTHPYGETLDILDKGILYSGIYMDSKEAAIKVASKFITDIEPYAPYIKGAKMLGTTLSRMGAVKSAYDAYHHRNLGNVSKAAWDAGMLLLGPEAGIIDGVWDASGNKDAVFKGITEWGNKHGWLAEPAPVNSVHPNQLTPIISPGAFSL